MIWGRGGEGGVVSGEGKICVPSPACGGGFYFFVAFFLDLFIMVAVLLNKIKRDP